MGRRLAGLISTLALAWGVTASAAEPLKAGPFAGWAAVVVAGDWHAHSGEPSEAFDNARRDVAAALQAAGFSKTNLRQFSVRPESHHEIGLRQSAPKAIYQALAELAPRAPDGCLAYFTSHGAPQGVLIDDAILTPGVLGSILNRACGAKPTVVVISACFSGVFVPPLAATNRMILTAARADRTSFGCGESDRYPYFDDCFLRAMPSARDFPALAAAVRACVAAREVKEGVQPPSEPQLYIGPQLRALLPLRPFAAAAAGG